MHRLFITCSACGSSYSVQRFEPTSHAAPAYCAWCGSERITCSQNADALASEVLAERYGLTPPQLTTLVRAFGQQTTHTHFTEYLRALVMQASVENEKEGESDSHAS